MGSESRQPTVEEAMRRAPRVDYLPRAVRHAARLDRPLSIGDGVTNSQPSTVRTMIEMLDVCPGQRVLDVGSGSGWTTGILAHLVGERGSVLGVELIARLVLESDAVLRAAGLTQARVAQAEPGVLGAPEEAPFDRILVSAEASEVPQELVDQLADEGIMVAVVQDRLVTVTRHGDAADVVLAPGRYRFVPLR